MSWISKCWWKWVDCKDCDTEAPSETLQESVARTTAERDEMSDRDNLLATYCERMGNCDGCIVARECTEMHEKRKQGEG